MASNDGINHFLKEWESARDVLRIFDDRLHDLRKYGFSFITAFLTANAILFETWVREPIPSVFEGEPFPEPVKATILIVSLLLIVGIFIIDMYYRFFQEAANTRARVLEKVLNIELSDVITQRYRYGWLHYLVTVVYLIFIGAAYFLGRAVLSSSLIWLSLSVLASGIGILFLSSGKIIIHYEYGKMDWILDRVECKPGDEVRIIMTNISDGPLPKKDIAEGEVMWKLFKEGEKETLRSGVASKDFRIASYHNYTWVLKTKKDENGVKDLDPGIYRIERRTLTSKGELKSENEMKPLSRKLRIISAPDSPPKPSVHHVYS